MWTITDLKEKGRNAFRRNYWKCVLVALVVGLLGSLGGSSNGSDDNNNQSYTQQMQNATSFEEIFQIQEAKEQQQMQDMLVSGVGASTTIFNKLTQFIEQFLPGSVSAIVSGLLMGAAGLFLAVMAIIVLIFNIIVTNVIEVGGARFFARNSYESQSFKEIFWGFKEGRYKNIVIAMFLRGLFTFLWYLLFIIPGIIKTYEYRMIPYILAENPDINWREAFARSKEMMMGQKMNAFILDFSFIGWHFLNAITLGCSGLFYSNPYELATDAELYLTLNGGFEDMTSQTDFQQRWQDAYDNGTVWEEGTDYQARPAGETGWQEYEPQNPEDDDRTYR